MKYYFNKTITASFDEAITKVTEELKKEGFGILTDIDVQQTLKKKLDVDFRKYRILGACQPSYAYKALQAEDKIGTMLPRNVIVQETGMGKVEVAAIDPIASMQAVDNKSLGEIADQVQGRARGIAVHESFGSFIAQVAEVSVTTAGEVHVHKVVCAVDCGRMVNPDTIEAQMEGAIVFGLSAALHGAITFKNGRVEQSNFNDYPILSMDEMPVIEVHIISSKENPGGIGEPDFP